MYAYFCLRGLAHWIRRGPAHTSPLSTARTALQALALAPVPYEHTCSCSTTCTSACTHCTRVCISCTLNRPHRQAACTALAHACTTHTPTPPGTHARTHLHRAHTHARSSGMPAPWAACAHSRTHTHLQDNGEVEGREGLSHHPCQRVHTRQEGRGVVLDDLDEPHDGHPHLLRCQVRRRALRACACVCARARVRTCVLPRAGATLRRTVCVRVCVLVLCVLCVYSHAITHVQIMVWCASMCVHAHTLAQVEGREDVGGGASPA